MQVFDASLDSVKAALSSDELAAYRHFRQLLGKKSPDERLLAVTQYALETFLHDLMVTFQESDSYAIVAKSEHQGIANLRNLTSVGLEFEQADWQAEHSKYNSISQQIV